MGSVGTKRCESGAYVTLGYRALTGRTEIATDLRDDDACIFGVALGQWSRIAIPQSPDPFGRIEPFDTNRRSNSTFSDLSPAECERRVGSV